MPVGLLAVGVAVLGDKERPAVVRGLPLIGTLAFAVGPVLVAALPDPDEGPVLTVWCVFLTTVWTAYGVLVAIQVDRRPGPAPAPRGS